MACVAPSALGGRTGGGREAPTMNMNCVCFPLLDTSSTMMMVPSGRR